MHAICILCGIPQHDPINGSTIKKSFFKDVASVLGLSSLDREKKQKLAERILISLDQPWNNSCFSEGGGTVTLVALERLEKGLRLATHQPTTSIELLDARVAEIQTEENLGPPPVGNQRPHYRSVTTEEPERDPKTKAWVLNHAKGICELCGTKAPFRSKRKNNPWYLEVHHVIPLKTDGPDTVCNAVALCANCHARCHHSVDSEEAAEKLYQCVKRLTR